MNTGMKWTTMCAVLIMVFLGCAQAADGKTGETVPSTPLSGEVSGLPFSFKSGYATLAGGKWSVYLWSSNADDEPDAADPTYPYLVFTLGETSGVQTYSVSFPSGFILTGWVNGTDGTFFDSGKLKITKLDTGAGVIEGWISKAATNEGTSSLTGTFTAAIRNN